MIRVTDRYDWKLQRGIRRIPSLEIKQWIGGADMLNQAREVLEEAEIKAKAIKHDAYQEGYAQGKLDAQREILSYKLSAIEMSRLFQRENEQKIVSVAAALVKKILVRLSKKDILLSMLENAFREIEATRYIDVFVQQEQIKITQQWIEQWKKEHGYVGKIEVQEDSSISPFCCRVVSEFGELRADPNESLGRLIETK